MCMYICVRAGVNLLSLILVVHMPNYNNNIGPMWRPILAQ